jgi:hypothetical protein
VAYISACLSNIRFQVAPASGYSEYPKLPSAGTGTSCRRRESLSQVDQVPQDAMLRLCIKNSGCEGESVVQAGEGERMRGKKGESTEIKRNARGIGRDRTDNCSAGGRREREAHR